MGRWYQYFILSVNITEFCWIKCKTNNFILVDTIFVKIYQNTIEYIFTTAPIYTTCPQKWYLKEIIHLKGKFSVNKCLGAICILLNVLYLSNMFQDVFL